MNASPSAKKDLLLDGLRELGGLRPGLGHEHSKLPDHSRKSVESNTLAIISKREAAQACLRSLFPIDSWHCWPNFLKLTRRGEFIAAMVYLTTIHSHGLGSDNSDPNSLPMNARHLNADVTVDHNLLTNTS
jgi:hypothetical protein